MPELASTLSIGSRRFCSAELALRVGLPSRGSRSTRRVGDRRARNSSWRCRGLRAGRSSTGGATSCATGSRDSATGSSWPSMRRLSSAAASARACSRRSWPRCDSVARRSASSMRRLCCSRKERSSCSRVSKIAMSSLNSATSRSTVSSALCSSSRSCGPSPLLPSTASDSELSRRRAGWVLYWNMRRSMTAAFT